MFTAAFAMKSAISTGFASIARWLDVTVMDFALICLAMASSNCGEIIRSFLATTYHEGFDFHAAVVTLPPNAAPEVGCCVAMIICFSAVDKSCAKSSDIPFGV